jgi:hypothetical protein
MFTDIAGFTAYAATRGERAGQGVAWRIPRVAAQHPKLTAWVVLWVVVQFGPDIGQFTF